MIKNTDKSNGENSYNSAVFTVFREFEYLPILVTRPFIENDQMPVFDQDMNPKNTTRYYGDPEEGTLEAFRLRELHKRGNLEHLETLQCIDAYAKESHSRGSVLVVESNNTIAAIHTTAGVYSHNWVCPDSDPDIPCEMTNGISGYKKDVSAWRPLNAKQPIAYCLSESPADACRIESSMQIMWIIVVINFVKVVTMFCVAQFVRQNPVLTVGDAIASFLEEPDPCTVGMCLKSKEDFKIHRKTAGKWQNLASVYLARRQKMFASASAWRWCFSIAL